MPPQEQAEMWMQLRDRMKVDWNEMTMQEKKAGMWDIWRSHVGASSFALEADSFHLGLSLA